VTTAFRLLGKGAEPLPSIRTTEDWRRIGAPKGGDKQWKPLRSAYELASAWCGDGSAVGPPADFVAMLTAHPLLRELVLTEGYAEHETPLRGERGGPRNHDLLLVGTAAAGKVVIGVEGKADEQFDRPLRERWHLAQRTLASGAKTNWPARLERLAPGLLGLEATASDGTLNPLLADVPYQLMSALAGTLIEAEERNAQLAVLLVHVFTSSATRDELVERNREVFADFVRRLASTPDAVVDDNHLYGPFAIPGGSATRIPSHIPVLVGELVTELGQLV
jgi:hypothetical protein